MKMWSVRLHTGDDGLVTVAAQSDGIPPGEIEIRGTDDGNRAVLNARQRDTRGRFIVSAHHVRDRAEEALEQAEELADVVDQAGGTTTIGVTVSGAVPAA